MLGKQAAYDRQIIALLELEKSDQVLDLGCGTGVLTRRIADRLDAPSGGVSVGIDAAAKLIRVVRKKRASPTCRFEVAAAKDLPFENASFDAVVSSLFFHHVPLDLKEKAFAEAWRVLRELSGGEIQRVAAARAMAHSPKILLADEPTASLDTATGKNLVQLSFDMGQEHECTLVIATHDPDIFHLAEKTVHLRDGRVVKPEDLLSLVAIERTPYPQAFQG